MGEIKKQGISNSIIILIGAAIGAVNVMILFPKIMPKEYFGLTRLLLEVSFLFGQIGLLGVSTGLIKFWKEVKNSYSLFKFALKHLLISSFIVLLFILLFKSSIIEMYQEKSPLFTSNYGYVYVLFLVLAFFELFSALSSAMLRSIIPIFLKDIVLRLLVSISILAYYFQLIDGEQFIFVFVFNYLLILLIIIIYTYYFNAKEIGARITKTEQKKFKNYSRVSFLTGLSSGIVNRLDVLMIPVLVVSLNTVNGGLGAVAIYSLALYVTNILEIPSRSFFAISTPIIARSWTDNDKSSILSIYKKTSINLTLISVLMFLLLWMNIDDLLSFLPDDYKLAKSVILILGISKIFNMLLGANNIILGLSAYYKVLTVVMIILIFLTTVFNYLFIPIYGISGAALGTLFSLVVYNVVSYLFLYYKYGFQPFSWKTLLIFAIALVSYFVISFITIDNLYFSIIIKSGVFTLLYLLQVYIFNVSEDITLVINKTYDRFLKRG